MKAITVTPGTPNSARLREIPKPSLQDIPEGRGVLVRILRVGLDGTDREINAGEYGAVPEGSDFLVLGHESLGRVEEVGPAVTEFAPGDLVVARVRRADQHRGEGDPPGLRDPAAAEGVASSARCSAGSGNNRAPRHHGSADPRVRGGDDGARSGTLPEF